jgi:hypothetical protein
LDVAIPPKTWKLPRKFCEECKKTMSLRVYEKGHSCKVPENLRLNCIFCDRKLCSPRSCSDHQENCLKNPNLIPKSRKVGSGFRSSTKRKADDDQQPSTSSKKRQETRSTQTDEEVLFELTPTDSYHEIQTKTTAEHLNNKHVNQHHHHHHDTNLAYYKSKLVGLLLLHVKFIS